MGAVAGAATALVTADAQDQDPLGIGVPLHDLACTGESVVLLGWGSHQSALSAAASDNPGARYLRTSSSCHTAWGYAGDNPDYAVYLGPMSVAQACRERMQHKGFNVTRLQAGSTQLVQCVCALDTASAPALSVGAAETSLDGIWVRNLQMMLSDLGLNPAHHVTGHYDATTARQVREFQTQRALSVTGHMDPETWRVLKNRACALYD